MDRERLELPSGAYEAIFAEHQRDHDDGPKWPREGCNGCAMLSHAAALQAKLAAAQKALRWCISKMDRGDGVLEYTGDEADVAYEKTVIVLATPDAKEG